MWRAADSEAGLGWKGRGMLMVRNGVACLRVVWAQGRGAVVENSPTSARVRGLALSTLFEERVE